MVANKGHSHKYGFGINMKLHYKKKMNRNIKRDSVYSLCKSRETPNWGWRVMIANGACA